MGIPGFYGSWLSKDVKQAIYNGLPQFVSSLSFDLNGVFHDARKTVFGEGDRDTRILQAIANTDPLQLELELQNAVAAIILRMVQAVQPRDCLILAVDGVAPAAKLQQQRGRRERAAKDRSPIETFDRNSITPGTEFMIRLDNFMVRFIGNYRDFLPPKVIYSSHLVPGEGEHKIMDYYRRGEVSDGLAAKEGGAHVLYGLDADLIMLSLLAPINNIYLSRETVKETINIDRLREYLAARSKRESSVDDFVVMMFLIGNDFLPHSPALEELSESVTSLLDTYAAGNYILTYEADGRRQINWDGMKAFIKAVAAREPELLAAASVRPVKYPSRFLQGALINQQFYPDRFRSLWYQNALGPKGSADFTNALTQIIGTYVPNEYDFAVSPDLAQNPITVISEVTPDRIIEMILNYIRTMAWVYLYYRQGTAAINQEWAYPHYHAPMLGDLAAVMQTIGVTNNITGFAAFEGMTTFTALHQLVAVLPMKSKELLPLELHPLFLYNSVIRDFFPDNFIIEMDGKNKDYEGTPIVPLIDRQRVIDAVGQVSFTPERAKLWLPADEQFFIRTEEEAARLAHIQYDKRRQAEFLARQTARAERGKTRRNPTHRTVQQLPTQPKPIVPTMTTTQAVRSPSIRGRGRGGRTDRGGPTDRGRGRGRGGRAAPQEIKRAPTAPQPTLTQLPQPKKVPTLVPIGATPVVLPVGRGTTVIGTQVRVAPIVPVGQPVVQPARSPAQWQQLANLM